MEPPHEIINMIQEYLPARDILNTRLVNKQWKHSADINDSLWSDLLDHLTNNVLGKSYLIQGYTLPVTTNAIFRDHPLQRENKERKMRMKVWHDGDIPLLASDEEMVETYQKRLAKETVNHWLLIGGVIYNNKTTVTTPYDKYVMVVKRLTQLEKSMPTPDIAERYLRWAYSPRWFDTHVTLLNAIKYLVIVMMPLVCQYQIPLLPLMFYVLITNIVMLVRQILLIKSCTINRLLRYDLSWLVTLVIIYLCLAFGAYGLGFTNNQTFSKDLIFLQGMYISFLTPTTMIFNMDESLIRFRTRMGSFVVFANLGLLCLTFLASYRWNETNDKQTRTDICLPVLNNFTLAKCFI